MHHLKFEVVFLVILILGLNECQLLGEPCSRPDGTRGICRTVDECESAKGTLWNTKGISVCNSSTIDNVIVCCRKTAAEIALQKCNEWKSQAGEVGVPRCSFSVLLTRGGSEAARGEFPHMVSLLTEESNGILVHRCGGSLIDKRFVLTAAHCVEDQKKLYVRVGGHNLSVADPGVHVSYVKPNIKRHPEFDIKSKSRYYDIAILELAAEARFSEIVRPACLPYGGRRIQSYEKLVVAGWGLTEGSRITSQVLQKADITVIDRLLCDNSSLKSANDRYPVGITDSIICSDERESGACKGDSGGPLMQHYDSQCQIKQVVGIVSLGPPGCESSTIPGTYTSVEYYLDWIVNTVWPEAY